MLRDRRTISALVGVALLVSCGGSESASERQSDGGGGSTGDGGPCSEGQTQSCYTGPPATQGIGACKDGTQSCWAGSFSACAGDVVPSDEQCDGSSDDDCDGTVDEGCSCTPGEARPCYGGPPGTEGTGVCKGGTQSCESGTWGACQGAVVPQAEACNGADDDCDGNVDDATGLRLYALPAGANAWSASYVSDLWTGPGAPPCSGLAAAVQLSDFDRLLVFGSDGTLYTRKNGAWQTPVAASTRFPQLPGPVDALYHIPHAWTVNFDPTAPLTESLTFTVKPDYFIYEYTPQDTATLAATGVIPEADPPGPDRPNGRELWTFEVMDLSKLGTGAAFLIHLEYDDGNAYQLDAAGAWQKWSVAQSPYWSGKANAPPVGQCIAGFYDQSKQVASLICP